MKSAIGADWNFVEMAVERLGGIKATAKAMCVTQKIVTTWLRRGTLDNNLARILGKKTEIAWQLLAGAGRFYY